MKIFVAHSSNFDFEKDLYRPLRNSILDRKHQITLPQEKDKLIVTKEMIKDFDCLVAEASYPSTGQGIELGWADVLNIPIICLFKEESKISSSLRYVTDNLISYKDKKDMVSKLDRALNILSN